LELAQRFGVQTELLSVARMASEAVPEVAAADRGYCLLYDRAEQVLWSKDRGTGEERNESAAAGIVSFVARTGRRMTVREAARDVRYNCEADDPRGDGTERLLAVPVTDERTHVVLAVIMAVRTAGRPDFEPEHVEYLELLARHVAVALGRLSLQSEIDRMSAGAGAGMNGTASDIFREEALKHHLSGTEHGDVLRLSPDWINSTYWIIVATALASLVYVAVGRIDEYATGIGVVRLEGRLEVTATTAGTVSRIEAEPGRPVRAGDPLVRLNDAQERADLERVEREFDLHLLARLRDPADAASALSLAGLRAQKVLADARAAERLIRAPEEGVVSDIRIREGQSIGQGDGLLTLAREGTGGYVIALLPGQYRPKLRPGLPLRLTLDGFPQAPQQLVVESVGDEVIGREEVHRYLGSRISADALPPGPLVVVRASLPSSTFESDGRGYFFHEGMLAMSEVRTDSEPLLLVLVPGLKALLRG
jgi:membrane fusion protein (multidrug efflux system)